MPKIPDQSSRYHVAGDVLEHKDFETLTHPNWLNDKVVNAYLLLLRNQANIQDDGHIYVMPSYVPVQWSSSNLQPWLFHKVKLHMFQWLLIPINVDNSHWILLCANPAKKTVSLLDSLPGRDNSRYLEQFRKYMDLRSEATGELAGHWMEDRQLQSARQTDGVSCRAFVLLEYKWPTVP
ncbi:sentrin-specific protease 1-like [Strongylocentrotus purpuratus]|uniref:Ubiquitin-like protease family profile domain-containing protein n=1 Tax=Strongylocentrotus purpuratus TaxID=7668 RepID=A0A7M7NNN8_STRPU|nr:sentrin-specific protease 1-like [Strongylocentrotus purpuratus]